MGAAMASLLIIPPNDVFHTLTCVADIKQFRKVYLSDSEKKPNQLIPLTLFFCEGLLSSNRFQFRKRKVLLLHFSSISGSGMISLTDSDSFGAGFVHGFIG